MEKRQLMSEVVTIESAETKKTSSGSMLTKLKTQAGKTFNVFHNKSQGGETKAFEKLKTLPMTGIGATLELLYSEKDIEIDGKTFKTRSVAMIKDAPAQEVAPQGQMAPASPQVDDMQVSNILF